MNINIRKFERKYMTEMVRLYERVYSPLAKRITEKMARHTINYCLKSSPEFCLEAVSDSGDCLGAIFCRRDESFLKPVYYIESIQVKPEFRRKGIGTLLMKALISQAKQMGVIRINIDFDSSNQRLLAWYPKFGFKPTGFIVYDLDL